MNLEIRVNFSWYSWDFHKNSKTRNSQKLEFSKFQNLRKNLPFLERSWAGP